MAGKMTDATCPYLMAVSAASSPVTVKPIESSLIVNRFRITLDRVPFVCEPMKASSARTEFASKPSMKLLPLM